MLSIIIPVYNEWQSLKELHNELEAAIKINRYSAEILFIDDGSTDPSWQVIKELAGHDPRVRGLRLRRNFGKSAALQTGITAAQGDILITLDADLQHNPYDIPHLLDELNKGYDMVSGWQKIRRDSWYRRLASRLFNWLVARLANTKLHDINCGMKCYRRAIFKNIRIYGDFHRFTPLLAAGQGWKIGEAIINNRPRKFGRSKYAEVHKHRALKGIIDLLAIKTMTSYGERPQHLFGSLGIVLFAIGLLTLGALTIGWLITYTDSSPANNRALYQNAIFYLALAALLAGLQCISIGLMAGLMRAYHKEETDNIAEQISR